MKLILITVVSLFLLSFGHFLGLKGFYYSLNFYDDILHFLLGGLSSLIIFLFLVRLEKRGFIQAKKIFYFSFIFFFAITIGVGWEFFEFFYFPYLQLEVADIIKDIFWGGVGSFSTLTFIFMNFKFFSKI